MSNNQHPGSLDDYKNSLDYLYRVKDTRVVAKKLLEMGDEQKRLKNYEKAREKYIVAFKVYQDEGNVLGEASALKDIADLWKTENRYPEARKYYRKALKRIRMTGNHHMESDILELISDCYQAEGSLEDAAKIQGRLSDLNHKLNQSKDKLQQSTLMNSHQMNKLKNRLDNISPTRYQVLWLIFYMATLLLAQLTITHYSETWGLLIQAFLIICLITASLSTESVKFTYFLQALIILPLIGIINLNFRVIQASPLYLLGIISVPLVLAIYILMKNQNITREKAGLVAGNLPIQLILGSTGVALGVIAYWIMKPPALLPDLNPFAPGLSLVNVVLAGVILMVTTGFLDELLFRGMIQRLGENVMGNYWSIIFTSILYTIIYGLFSPLNMVFVLLISLYYGLAFQKTRSVLGISISHGLCNAVLYMVLPFIML